jgi:hypothetical protein
MKIRYTKTGMWSYEKYMIISLKSQARSLAGHEQAGRFDSSAMIRRMIVNTTKIQLLYIN